MTYSFSTWGGLIDFKVNNMRRGRGKIVKSETLEKLINHRNKSISLLDMSGIQNKVLSCRIPVVLL